MQCRLRFIFNKIRIIISSIHNNCHALINQTSSLLLSLQTDKMKMEEPIKDILEKDDFSKSEIIALLKSEKEDQTLLFQKSAEVKEANIGNKVWFRGLIEFSNICGKDCLYCGIRKGNKNLVRYDLSDDEILSAAEFAYRNRYGSIALQSGELESKSVTNRIEALLNKIKKLFERRTWSYLIGWRTKIRCL